MDEAHYFLLFSLVSFFPNIVKTDFFKKASTKLDETIEIIPQTVDCSLNISGFFQWDVCQNTFCPHD